MQNYEYYVQTNMCLYTVKKNTFMEYMYDSAFDCAFWKMRAAIMQVSTWQPIMDTRVLQTCIEWVKSIYTTRINETSSSVCVWMLINVRWKVHNHACMLYDIYVHLHLIYLYYLFIREYGGGCFLTHSRIHCIEWVNLWIYMYDL